MCVEWLTLTVLSIAGPILAQQIDKEYAIPDRFVVSKDVGIADIDGVGVSGPVFYQVGYHRIVALVCPGFAGSEAEAVLAGSGRFYCGQNFFHPSNLDKSILSNGPSRSALFHVDRIGYRWSDIRYRELEFSTPFWAQGFSIFRQILDDELCALGGLKILQLIPKRSELPLLSLCGNLGLLRHNVGGVRLGNGLLRNNPCLIRLNFHSIGQILS